MQLSFFLIFSLNYLSLYTFLAFIFALQINYKLTTFELQMRS